MKRGPISEPMREQVVQNLLKKLKATRLKCFWYNEHKKLNAFKMRGMKHDIECNILSPLSMHDIHMGLFQCLPVGVIKITFNMENLSPTFLEIVHRCKNKNLQDIFNKYNPFLTNLQPKSLSLFA